MRKLTMLFLALCIMASLAVPASAVGPIECVIDGMSDPEYGKPTSIQGSHGSPAQRVPWEKEEQGSGRSFRRQAETELSGLCDDAVHTADGGAMKNEDVSKNAALAPPTFGSASADTLNTGSPLTPNLAPGYQPAADAVINGSSAVIQPPAMGGVAADSGSGAVYVPGASTVTVTNSNSTSGDYTEVTDDLYYKGGYIATLKIPCIDVNVKVYEGTGNAVLAKGAGHFVDTSIWDGNCCIAGHNRGTNGIFGNIHNLSAGDKIMLTTKLGKRIYEVTSVSKVSETDRSALAASTQNMITLYTCVRDQRDQRWCVQGVEVR